MDSSNIPMLFAADISFLTAKEKHILLDSMDKTGGAEKSLLLLTEQAIGGIVKRDVHPKEWSAEDCLKRAKEASFWMKSLNITAVTDEDGAYPPLLLDTADRPFLLFCRGNAECLRDKTVSVVGTRHVSPQGREAAKRFAFDAAKVGVSVVSGLAMGVDGEAHRGTLLAMDEAIERGEKEAAGKAIAVLPCGADGITPAVHKQLAQKIIALGGCLISEYLPGSEAAAWRYVHRNRIIAGMSAATLVAEAPTGSGALITARYAAEYNRDVFFHEAAFCQAAQAFSAEVKTKLEAGHALGRVPRAKLENTVQKYIDSGAIVIKDYADFCRRMNGSMGKRQKATGDEQLAISKDY